MSEKARRRLRVNPILCDGYGYCAEIVPDLVTLDDWGFPVLAATTIEDGDLSGLAERAVATRPRLALLLEEI